MRGGISVLSEKKVAKIIYIYIYKCKNIGTLLDFRTSTKRGGTLLDFSSSATSGTHLDFSTSTKIKPWYTSRFQLKYIS